jgi:lipopolysaccharide transport system ATP-binding protein
VRSSSSDLSPFTDGHIWALKDICFEVKQGEVIGIIGRNGAGKSTLLKILTRITRPTEGYADIDGRVGSLLEVGTGFHPELTGRENIYLNGAILGMKKEEIRRNFDEIVAFAEVEKFIDTPVKHYSSGMYVRLAFAVAAHLEPEILIVDEVLAVGDAEFQNKCLGKMEDVATKQGRTVLFVSHNMAAIEGICASAILLTEGKIACRGDAKHIVREYMSHLSYGNGTPLGERGDRQGSGVVRFKEIALFRNDGEPVKGFQCGKDATLVLTFENVSKRELRNMSLSLGIDNDFGQRVLLLDSTMCGQNLEKVPLGIGQVKISIPRLSLVPGRYHCTLFAAVNGIMADWVKSASVLKVEMGDYYGTGQFASHGQGLFLTEHSFAYAVGSDKVNLCSDVSIRSRLSSGAS